jgi:hypothetical protein
MPLMARTASYPTNVILFLFILCYTDLALGVSSFHHKLTGHQAAANKAFHDNLLAQLAASKQQKTNFDNVPENRLVLPNDVDTATTSTLESFAVDANPTFQIYFNSTLPTNPAPPAACATALMATINCNETITLMG